MSKYLLLRTGVGGGRVVWKRSKTPLRNIKMVPKYINNQSNHTDDITFFYREFKLWFAIRIRKLAWFSYIKKTFDMTWQVLLPRICNPKQSNKYVYQSRGQSAYCDQSNMDKYIIFYNWIIAILINSCYVIRNTKKVQYN